MLQFFAVFGAREVRDCHIVSHTVDLENMNSPLFQYQYCSYYTYYMPLLWAEETQCDEQNGNERHHGFKCVDLVSRTSAVTTL